MNPVRAADMPMVDLTADSDVALCRGLFETGFFSCVIRLCPGRCSIAFVIEHSDSWNCQKRKR